MSAQTLISKLKKEIEHHKEVVRETEEKGVKTRVSNLINKKLKMIKCLENFGNTLYWQSMYLHENEKFKS